MNMRTMAAGLLVLLSMIVMAAGCGGSESSVADGTPAEQEPSATRVDEPAAAELRVGEPKALAPLLYVVHGDADADEFEPVVYIGAAGQAELSSLVAATFAASPDARIETVLGLDDDAGHLIDETNPDVYFFVTGGYYCGSGGLLLDVSRTALELRTTQLVSCYVPQPVSSVFIIERAAVDDTFDLLYRDEWEDTGRVVAHVEEWVVVDR